MKRLITFAAIAACTLPTFLIAGEVETVIVDSPESGNIWKACTYETIEWTYIGEQTPEFFEITWSEIGAGYYVIDTVAGNIRSYRWSVGNPCIHAILRPIGAIVCVHAKISGGWTSGCSGNFTIVPYNWP